MIRTRRLARQVAAILTCASSFAAAAESKPAKPASGTIMAWVAEQNTSMVGPQTVYITKDYFKVVMKGLHVALLIRAPEGTITLSNDSSRKYIDVPTNDAQGIFSFQRTQKMRPGQKMFREVPIKLSTGMMLGRHVTEYVYPHNPMYLMEPATGDRLARMTQDGKKLSAEDKHYYDLIMRNQRREFWVASDIEVPSQIAPVFGIDAKIKQSLKLPLKMVQVSKSGDRATAIETVSLKHMPVPESTFARPQGYAHAANQMEILMDDGSAQEETDMFGSSVKNSGGPSSETRARMQDALKSFSTPKQGGK